MTTLCYNANATQKSLALHSTQFVTRRVRKAKAEQTQETQQTTINPQCSILHFLQQSILCSGTNPPPQRYVYGYRTQEISENTLASPTNGNISMDWRRVNALVIL